MNDGDYPYFVHIAHETTSMNDLERFRLQTSFVIKSVTAEEFRRYAKTFRAHMQDTKGIENVEVRIGFGKHIEVSFDIKACSFSDANLRSGKIILTALKRAQVNAGDLSDIERLKDANALDKATGLIACDQSTTLSLMGA